MRSTERYAFMECGGSYFVLAKSTHHVNPNDPGEDTHDHAFIMDKEEFDRAIAVMKARGTTYVGYFDTGHVPFRAAMPISMTPTATASKSSIT
jgi:hypothetical protein